VTDAVQFRGVVRWLKADAAGSVFWADLQLVAGPAGLTLASNRPSAVGLRPSFIDGRRRRYAAADRYEPVD